MKKISLITALFGSSMAYALEPASSTLYVQMATQKQLAQDTTWQRLMYADSKGQSEVGYAGYFLSPEGGKHLQDELNANISALFLSAAPNQSVRCRFPARSQWLIKQLNISTTALPQVECPELDKWLGEIKPYKATLIYATDFMGNPSSMFGHTLLRLDPKDQKQLNLVSYAVNYAATVAGEDGLPFAWKGLTGQYPGEYSLMPYYRKVKEYGDLESRDLWEYELNLNPEETRFLVQHIWEMQRVSFPYYFVSDNCAYRLLGLIDLVRPELNLKQQFKVAAIPMQTIKAIDQQGIVSETVYRPALETQLLAQARQHGQALAKTAHQVAFAEQKQRLEILAPYSAVDRAKILEMAYDDLYLQFVARKVDQAFAQPNLRELLTLRSSIDIERQRNTPERPRIDPTQSHDARHFSVKAGTVQGDEFIELGHRQAYHDLIDPQGGYRVGTQLLFWDGSIQFRQDELKLEHFDFLTVNSYNPITAFKTPLTWGFNLAWQQEALTSSGRFSEDNQHGVASLKTQMGYSYADSKRENLCYAQMQTYLQGGKSLDKGWRLGMGPTVGCQNIWSDRINSIVQLELPYWEDSHQWQVRLNSQLQYALNAQNALRIGWEYQYQNEQDWNKLSFGYVRFF